MLPRSVRMAAVADGPKVDQTAKTMEHAAIAALYFRRLVAEGVPPTAAATMTSSYVMGLMIGDREEKSRDPWDLPPEG